jgi:hypothetical protein
LELRVGELAQRMLAGVAHTLPVRLRPLGERIARTLPEQP